MKSNLVQKIKYQVNGMALKKPTASWIRTLVSYLLGCVSGIYEETLGDETDFAQEYELFSHVSGSSPLI